MRGDSIVEVGNKRRYSGCREGILDREIYMGKGKEVRMCKVCLRICNLFKLVGVF